MGGRFRPVRMEQPGARPGGPLRAAAAPDDRTGRAEATTRGSARKQDQAPTGYVG
jgi:hypothetical protein